VIDGRPDQRSFGSIDIAVRRNAYGRQVDSFEANLDVAGLDSPFPAVFIRAPIVESAGPPVTVLARHEGRPVLAQQGHVTVAAFHPELAGDSRLHALFLEEVLV
jgi:5'-phosphate synthase pdxT subunit